jgi:hypothetical protein
MNVGRLLCSPSDRRSSAVSSESQVVAVGAANLWRFLERSYALSGKKASTISSLRTIAAECAEPDWDGDGAKPISLETIRNAEAFLRALPDWVPFPELSPEPDGAFSLDWIRSRNRMLSVSLGARARLAIAWLDGSNRGHAMETFDGSTIPDLILLKVRATMDVTYAPIRVA